MRGPAGERSRSTASKRLPSSNEVANVDVPPGSHTLVVRVPGFEPASQGTSIMLGTSHDMTFALTPRAPVRVENPDHSSFPVRKFLAVAALVVGAGGLVVGGIEDARWLNDKSKNENDRMNVPKSIKDACTTQVNNFAVDACKTSNDAVTASTAAWLATGVGAAFVLTGVLLLATDKSSNEPPPEAATRSHVDLVRIRSACAAVRSIFD